MHRSHIAALVLAVVAAPAARGQLDPNAFPSLGTLNVSSGTLNINTDTLTMSGAASFTGVALNQNGGPQVAVFDFSSITIGSGVTVSLIGSRPLALLSRGNATIQTSLAVPTGLNGPSTPFLGGYAGGSIYPSSSGGNALLVGQGGGGPGGGGALADATPSAAGGGGYGGKGGPTVGGLSGIPYGNLFQTLQGGGGGGAVAFSDSGDNFASARADAGAGGGALEVVATGALTVAAVSAVGTSGNGFVNNDSSAVSPSYFQAAGGAGGGILLSGGTGLSLTGTVSAQGGDALASTGLGNTSGGGGGRVVLSGLSSYTLGTSLSNPFVGGGTGASGGGTGFAGVITVDALSTTIPSGTSVTLNGGPFISVAGSTTQTTPTIEAYARQNVIVNGTAVLAATNACQNLTINTNATATLEASNAFQVLNSSGAIVTDLIENGTLDLNGFSQTVDTLVGLSSAGTIRIPAGSTLSIGISNSVANGGASLFNGQITGAGALVKLGTGELTLQGANSFTGTATVNGGILNIGAQALQNSTVTLAGGSLSFISATNPIVGALAGTGNVSLAGLASLAVGGNNASTTYGGSLSGSLSGGLIKNGIGVWTLTGTNTQTGPFNVQNGSVLVGSTGALSPGAPITVSAGATLDLNGYNYAVTSTNPLTVQGNLRLGQAGVSVASGATATYNGGTVSGGFLRGAGTHVVTGGAVLSGVTTFNSTTVNVTGAGTFQNFTSGGGLNIAAGLASPVLFDGFSNEGSGSITIGSLSKANASDFQSYGTMTINPAMITENFSQTTLLTNAGTSQLSFNGGSRTFVGTPQTAVFPSSSPQAGQPTFVAGIDLNGKNAVVAGGLFVNNGYVEDSTNGFQGTATIVADFGSLVKGAGFFQNSVQTINGGKFQAGNSPGSATFGKFVLGPGGVSSYAFAIDDATGAAGPTPDAAGHVSGWGLVKAMSHLIGGSTTPGDFVWTATPADKLLVSLETLVNPTTVGTDVPGLMDHFDPTRPYVWSAVEWSGNYAGPADATTLDASTAFDTGGFVNPIMGSFGWRLDPAGDTLSLTYTPSAVPEPGTLLLTAMAAGCGWLKRRWVNPTN